jgi:galactokinase/galacturonokinase
MPHVVVSPYRFNPLGAHIDHQGGSVLARCLNQYTILCFWPSDDESSTISCALHGNWQRTSFSTGQLEDKYGWDSMVRAAAAAFNAHSSLKLGINGVVFGTLVSGGLSSSASVVLAYLTAFALVNDTKLNCVELVELCRQVENDYRGLNNGIQDQMSIAFGKSGQLTRLHVDSVTAEWIPDPANATEMQFLMCFSGITRDLAGSAFNTRVAECRQAAKLLCPDAEHLGQVAENLRDDNELARLPEIAQRRARHVYSEMARVAEGADVWRKGDWQTFGRLMNESCQSSIHQYESGSEWLIALHEMATTIDGVFGSRFSGGGYGGCLFMLVVADKAAECAQQLMALYLARYPELATHARIQIASSEDTVRLVQL